MSLMYAISHGDFPTPTQHEPDLPLPMESIILRSMALRPEDRYPSVFELGQALLPFGSGRGRLLWEPVFGVPTPEGLLQGPASAPASFMPSARGPIPLPAPPPKAPLRLTSALGSAARWLVAFGVGVALSWGALHLFSRWKSGDADFLGAPEGTVEGTN